MYQYWFINCNKCITLVSAINNRENWPQGMWEISELSLQFFSVNLKFLKLEVYFFKLKKFNKKTNRNIIEATFISMFEV